MVLWRFRVNAFFLSLFNGKGVPMTARQTRGVALLISAALFAILGGVNVATDVTPGWVSMILDGVSALAAILGIPGVVKPTLN